MASSFASWGGVGDPRDGLEIPVPGVDQLTNLLESPSSSWLDNHQLVPMTRITASFFDTRSHLSNRSFSRQHNGGRRRRRERRASMLRERYHDNCSSSSRLLLLRLVSEVQLKRHLRIARAVYYARIFKHARSLLRNIITLLPITIIYYSNCDPVACFKLFRIRIF